MVDETGRRVKRSDGSGSIRWRSGAWSIQVLAGRHSDGRPRFEHRTVHAPNTAAGRRKAETVARNLYDQAKARAAPPGSLTELVERYIDQRRDDWTAGEAHRNRQMLDGRVLDPLGATPVDRLTTADLNDLYTRLRRRGLSPGSVRRTHGFVHAALEFAVSEGVVDRNPAARANLPRRTDPGPQQLPNPERLRDVITAASPTLAVLIALGLHTGARTGELVGLRWSDLDLDDRAARILQTKTGRWKAIALGSRTTVLLDRWRRQVADQYESVYYRPMPGGWWVFPSPRNPEQPWRSTSVSHAWARLDTGGVAFKALRKTMATVLLTHGYDIRTVMGRGGWSASSAAPDAAVMLVHYAQFVADVDRHAAETLDGWLYGSAGPAVLPRGLDGSRPGDDLALGRPTTDGEKLA